ncbi:MAG: hypothetical protein ACFFCQ_06690 [Promethearchaeota archaeon]
MSGKSDFFDQNKQRTDTNALSSIVAVYLYFFDESRGHIPLLAYPHHWLNNQEENKVLTIHSIWWLSHNTEDLQHIDLEFGGRIFSACCFKCPSFREKSRAGLKSETPERLVLFVSAPTVMSPLSGELAYEITTKIKNKIKPDQIHALILKDQVLRKIFKTAKDRAQIQEGLQAEKVISQIFSDCIPFVRQNDIPNFLRSLRVQRTEIQVSEDLGSRTDYDVGDSARLLINGLSKRKVCLNRVTLVGEDKIEIVLENCGGKLLDRAEIQISHISDLFETHSWNTSLDQWWPHEELVFQFPRIPEDENEYILSVEVDGKHCYSHKITTEKLRADYEL